MGRWNRRPYVWCRTDYHAKCPVFVKGEKCRCDCHKDDE